MNRTTLSPFKAILFDYDDTLVKTRESKWAAIQETARRYYDLEINSDHIAQFWGLPFEKMLTGALENADSFENLRDNYFVVTTEFPMTAYPRAVEAIEKLSKDFIVGIVTASARKLVLDDLARLDFPIDSFFHIQTAEDTTVHKPDPKVFEPILSKLQREEIYPHQVLYIGDSVKDFHSARDADLAFLGITHGTSSEDEFNEQGADTFSSFEELIDQLEIS